ncbi:TadG family pilus assembly protein [Methylopila turkensis]|uniref:DUF2134 domain-containing protein n=1 Tax=Methylopila turkensis TaxID=1437816 RepID=A0A9W6JKL1_9HYPH|nr:TadG family pilus assembly protein [Methylopila turkensis]GLK78772.1 hypothetical protein GCM10008174_05130 [Methylopila turkensis]
MRALARRFRRDEGGAVAVLVAALCLCAAGLLAVSIDAASIYLDRRKAQSAVDLAALAAASDLANAERAARATLAANGVAGPREFRLTLGQYTPDPRTASGGRFRAGTTPYNAAKVEIGVDASFYFAKAFLSQNSLVVRSAGVAASTQLASFSIGSRLASLNGGVVNALLSKLLGGSVSLSVMDHNALASAKVEVTPLLTALGARVNVTAGTYGDVLSARVRATDLISAMADVAQGSSSVSAALRRVAAAADVTRLVDMTKLISLGDYARLAIGDATSALSAGVSALDLLNVAAQAANGANQIALDLGAQIPGLLGLTATIDIGERPQNSPWLAIGSAGTVVRTAQTRLRLAAQVGGSGALLGRVINLPIAVDLAAAEARISAISCGRQPRLDGRVTVQATPALTEMWVGEPASASGWSGFSANPQMNPATLLNVLGLVRATAEAHAAATNVAPTPLVFSYDDIAAGAMKSVKTTNAAQTTLATLVGGLKVNVSVLGFLGLGLTGDALESLLKLTLAPVGALIDPVLNTLLQTLGLAVGEADVTVRGLRCDGSALVG